MDVLFLILPVALVMAGGFLWAFFYSVRKGQFDDLDTPRYRAIFDDVPTRRPRL